MCRYLVRLCVLFFAVYLVSDWGLNFRPGNNVSLFWPANVLAFSLFIHFRLRRRHVGRQLLHNALLTVISYSAMLVAALSFEDGSGIEQKVIYCAFNIGFYLPAWLCFIYCFHSRFLQRSTFTGNAVLVMTIPVVAGAFCSAAVFGLWLWATNSADIYQLMRGWFSEQLSTGIIFVCFFIRFKAIFRTVRRQLHRGWQQLRPQVLVIVFLVFVLLCVLFSGTEMVALILFPLAWFALRYSFKTTVVLCMLTGVALNYLYAVRLLEPGTGVTQADLDAMLNAFRLNLSILIMAILMVSRVVSANKILLKRIESGSSRDVLSGALNRRAFLAQLSRLCTEREGLAHREVAILFLDIDNFKKINDIYGHSTGDDVIRHFVALLKKQMRQNDLICRWGGEEFIIAALDLSPPDALLLGERLRAWVALTPVKVPGAAPLSFTTSVGISAFRCGLGENIHLAINRADEALYEAKKQGRNRVKMYPPS
ncbi:Diguanylate cyclase [Enterobacter sp. FY-07]|uniref:GGDEF domain-containing protein n=1 Tax=Kosakonia oryzendophytica TaxID=1005665 RepID=UPI00077817D0|nr:GGDEF domain-containing protein [Kosakonia oryzendophytica]AMO47189.1 Diguanylate cyclase [Enterobacter sp. FY-07]WBT58929.1 GGDEF domain-containing protein [Kosakonia oryzendophytica]